MNLIKLIRKSTGFQPEGYEWYNYRPTTNPYVIRHDLYEHQTGENGDLKYEVRALGGFYWFRDINESLKVIHLNLFWNLGLPLATKALEFDKHAKLNVECLLDNTDSKALTDFKSICHNECGINNPNFFVQLLADGYLNAKKFSKEAYNNILDINFESLHQLGQDIYINLDRGVLINE